MCVITNLAGSPLNQKVRVLFEANGILVLPLFVIQSSFVSISFKSSGFHRNKKPSILSGHQLFSKDRIILSATPIVNLSIAVIFFCGNSGENRVVYLRKNQFKLAK